MAEVQHDDDSIRRYVVQHYRYVPERRQRRYVVVAAFDNKREFEERIDEVEKQIANRRAAGLDVDPYERAMGVIWEPGHLARAAAGHQVRRFLRHGVNPYPYVDSSELPHNMSYLRRSRPWGLDHRPLLVALLTGLVTLALTFPVRGVDSEPPVCRAVLGYAVGCGQLGPVAAALIVGVIAGVAAAALRRRRSSN